MSIYQSKSHTMRFLLEPCSDQFTRVSILFVHEMCLIHIRDALFVHCRDACEGNFIADK